TSLLRSVQHLVKNVAERSFFIYLLYANLFLINIAIVKSSINTVKQAIEQAW
ncbi:MAG: hypothetical protein RLZZ316_2892, partial [Bacteroidota bacterium]